MPSEKYYFLCALLSNERWNPKITIYYAIFVSVGTAKPLKKMTTKRTVLGYIYQQGAYVHISALYTSLGVAADIQNDWTISVRIFWANEKCEVISKCLLVV